MSIIWYSAPEGEVASSALEKDLQRERTMYRIFSVNWILIAACRLVISASREIRMTSDDLSVPAAPLSATVSLWKVCKVVAEAFHT